MRRSRRLGVVTLVLSLAVLFAGGLLVRAEARVTPLPGIQLAGDVRMVNWYEGPSTALPLLQATNSR